jgi:hypothetical protein
VHAAIHNGQNAPKGRWVPPKRLHSFRAPPGRRQTLWPAACHARDDCAPRHAPHCRNARPRRRFRYVANLLYNQPWGEHFCTGSLITPSIVLTAAHVRCLGSRQLMLHRCSDSCCARGAACAALAAAGVAVAALLGVWL